MEAVLAALVRQCCAATGEVACPLIAALKES
jgi:hypothetical protein